MDRTKYNFLKLVAAGLFFFLGIGQVLLIIFKHDTFKDGTWYLFAAVWITLGGYEIISYFKQKKKDEEKRKYIQEQEDLLYHRKRPKND